jgi:uncharacterized membrane-anchored protein YhcB (DUF1043 family)
MSNSDNRPLKVQVDEVNSPKIDAINRATQRISNWLHNDLREIIKPLQSLKSLPDDVGDLKKRLIEQFRKLFVGQVTAEMKAREANIRVGVQKSELVETHIERKKGQLEESQERIRSRFGRLAKAVSKDHANDLERLDSHAYRITEHIYPEQVQERFSYESPVFWRALAQHSVSSANARSECLLEGNESAQSAVSTFLDRREAFDEALEAMSCSAQPGRYALPYWAVRVEDPDTGEERTDVLFPWDLQKTDPPVSEDALEALRSAVLKRETDSLLSADGPPETQETLSQSLQKQIASVLAEDHSVPSKEVRRFKEDAADLEVAM